LRLCGKRLLEFGAELLVLVAQRGELPRGLLASGPRLSQ
jgi:hypothetical protein